MEILVIIVAFWLVLVGAYGGLTLLSSNSKRTRRRGPGATRRAAEQPSPTRNGASAPIGGLFSEVDLLRAQVEHLRTEVVALSETATRYQRPRTRRYRTGFYADLPKLLRRHVKEVRNVRHPLGI